MLSLQLTGSFISMAIDLTPAPYIVIKQTVLYICLLGCSLPAVSGNMPASVPVNIGILDCMYRHNHHLRELLPLQTPAACNQQWQWLFILWDQEWSKAWWHVGQCLAVLGVAMPVQFQSMNQSLALSSRLSIGRSFNGRIFKFCASSISFIWVPVKRLNVLSVMYEPLPWAIDKCCFSTSCLETNFLFSPFLESIQFRCCLL